MVATEIIDRRYVAIGGAAELLSCRELEVLCESGAGTGKSHSLLRDADIVAKRNKKAHILFVRDTRKSMNDTILKEFEEAVLWPGHPAITGTATREHRDSYEYPTTGARIVLAGCDNLDRVMSSQFDRIFVFEATEITEEDWQKLISRLRNGKTPFHQIVADCNPSHKYHWLNTRFPQEGDPNPMPVMGVDQVTGEYKAISYRRRIRYRHEDNPRFFDPDTGAPTEMWMQYFPALNALVGAERERLLNHKWVSAEGQIWPEFDEAVHCVYRKDIPELRSYTASMDFGTNAPGCLQVWGYDNDQRAYRVAEVYKRGWSIDQWADAMVELNKEYPFQIGIGDCAAAGDILFLNKRLRAERGEKFGWVGCDKTKGATYGRDLVRDLIRRRTLFFVKDSIRFGADESLRAKRQPLCTEQEIPGYVYRKTEEGKDVKEDVAPGAADHGCDATIYNSVYKFGRDINPAPTRWNFPKPKWGEMSLAADFLEIAEKENW